MYKLCSNSHVPDRGRNQQIKCHCKVQGNDATATSLRWPVRSGGCANMFTGCWRALKVQGPENGSRTMYFSYGGAPRTPATCPCRLLNVILSQRKDTRKESIKLVICRFFRDTNSCLLC